MECPKCGKENPDQMKFCGYCGTPFDKATQEVIVPTDFKFQDEDGDGIPDDLPKSLVLVKEGPEEKKDDIKEEVKEEVKEEEKPVVEIVEEPKEEEAIPEVKEPAALANMGKPKEEKKVVKKKEPKDKEEIHKTVQLIITIILVILFIIVLFGTLVERGIIKM